MMASVNDDDNGRQVPEGPRPAALRAQTVESALASPRAAMLTAAQFAEAMRLRTAFDRAREAGDSAESARLEKLILSLVREGPPSLA